MPLHIAKCPYGPTNTFTVSTPVGHVEVVSCPRGLHSMGIVDGVNDSNFVPQPHVPVVLVSQLYSDNGYTYMPATQCLTWLQAYFTSGDKHELLLPKLCSHIGKEGSFTNNVWITLLKEVPYGQTISYGALARLCGNPKASRAVGQAMRNNPIGLIIPCHRVIHEGGRLGNYHHGTRNKVKEWLLQHEGAVK